MILALVAVSASLFQSPSFVSESDVSFRYSLPAISKGFSLVSGADPSGLKDVAEPNLVGGFGVGFDVYNPKEKNPFNANGNIYDRPQREVSLHWNGTEIANRLSSAEIQTAAPQVVKVKVENTIGGSLVSIWVGKTAVYDHFLVPGMRPLGQPWQAVGASGDLQQTAGHSIVPEAVTHVNVFKGEVNDANRHHFDQTVALPQDAAKFARVIGTLTLAPTEKGLDPWDRIASLSIKDDKGHRFELIRCITPYRKGWSWTADLTYLLPLLQGSKTLTWDCETYAEGWKISFDLDFYEGKLSPRPFALVPLWQGTYELGNGKPLPAPMALDVEKAKRAEVFTTVTGHGMDPNTDNAAEFLPLWRKLVVNGHSVQNNLWTEDNYLNPCRPQGGTWKYDRAGWGPGTVVDPWKVDVTDFVKSKSQFDYQIQPYVNKAAVDGNPARHIIESVLVLYR